MSSRNQNIVLAACLSAAVFSAVWWYAQPHKQPATAEKTAPLTTKLLPPEKQATEAIRTPEEIQITAAAVPCDRTVLTYLDLSRPPSEAELIAAGNLGEALTPTRPAEPTTIKDAAQRALQERDNLAFGTAIQAWNQHRYQEAYTLFEAHLKDFPDSPWAAESQLHLGCYCQYNGRLTEAAEWFDDILSTLEPKTEMHHKAKLRRSILHLDQGNLVASMQGFTEMKRDASDPAHQTYASYWIREIALLKKHETALRDCGQKALAWVAERNGNLEAARILRESKAAGPHGFTAAELHTTALEHGMDSRPVRADAALDDLPLPFVAHYEDRHYVAVERVTADDVRLYDSRVGEINMPRASFMKEWSGFALIFQEAASTAAIHPAEGLDAIIGGCCGHPRSPSDLGDDDDCDKNCGMPGWNVNPVNFNFRVRDTPLWWEPPVGPSVSMSLIFNSLDSLTNYQPFGAKWSFEYASYLLVTPGEQIQVRDGDGRLETFTAPAGGSSGYPITYTPPAGDFRTLVETADHVYTLTHQDGMVYHYGIPTAMAGNSSVPLLLAVVDRHNNRIDITHNAHGCVTAVEHSMLPALTPSGGGTPQARKWEFTYTAITLPETVTISGTAMVDYDADGMGNAAWSSKTLKLLDVTNQPMLDSEGQPLIVLTNALGQFTFPPLPPGTYQPAPATASSYPVVFTTLSTTTPEKNVNRVSRIDDPFSRSATFTYDAAANLISQTDMGGLSYGYEYTSKLSQNAVSTDNSSTGPFPLSQHEHFIRAIHTPKGSTQISIEPSNGRTDYNITSEEYAEGYGSAYPPLGSAAMWTNYRIRITNPENKTEEFHFDGAYTRGYHRNQIQLTRSSGQSVAPTAGTRTRYNYAIVGGVKGKINSIDVINTDGTVRSPHSATYSPTLLKQTAVMGPNGRWTSSDYHSNGKIQTVSLPKSNGSAYSSHTIHHTYQPNGLDIDKIQRYFDGTLRTVIDIDYHPGTRNIQQTKDALNRVTTYAWHPNGLPSSITDLTTGNVLAFEYDQGPHDGDGDPTWRQLRIKRNGTLVQQMDYDPIGRLAMQSDATGDFVQSVYDGLNRLTRADFSDGSFVEQLWECCFIGETRSGKVVAGNDRVHERTKFSHDGRGLLTQSIDTAGRITRYGYDDAGRMITLTDPLNRVTTWTFDGFGRADKKIYPDASYEQTTYNTQGFSVVQSLRNRAGQQFSLSFDAHSNPLTFSGPDVNFTRTYDGWDRLDTIKDTAYSNAVHNYDYDLLGRVTQLDGPWTNDTIGWQYLDSQRKIIRTTPGGVTETTISDSLDRIASIANPIGTFTHSYDGETSRPLTIAHSGGFDTSFSYHGAEHDFALETLISKLPGGAHIARHTYDYDKQNRISSWQREATLANPSGVTRSFEWTASYDFASQLTSVSEKSLAGQLLGAWDYVYDAAGNLATTQTSASPANPAAITNRSHNSLNQIDTLGGGSLTTIRGTLDEPGRVSVGIQGSGDRPARMLENNRFEAEVPLQQGSNALSITALDGNSNRSDYVFNVNVATRAAQSFTYDTNGNLLSDGVRSYEWDSLSRLKKVIWTTGKTTEFKYNALGQRCERIETDGSSVTRHYYLIDGISPIDRRTGTTADSAAIDRRYFTQGEQRHNGAGWDTYHYARDHLGSVREVVKSDSTLAARYDYDPYGKRLTQYQAATYAGVCEFGFTGHFTTNSLAAGQSELVLTHYRAYDSELGRWLSADPIGEEGGMNLYAYVRGEPLQLTDILGLNPDPYNFRELPFTHNLLIINILWPNKC